MSEPAPKKAKASKPKAAKAEGGAKKGGFSKEFQLSAKLAAFMGSQKGSRSEIVKQLWVYIKENGLQDPADKRNILNDDKLQDLFGVEKMSMFSMNKYLNAHIGKAA